jgi:hypothetical protein
MMTDDIADYLSEVTIPVRLACNTESGWPIVVSLWYLYEAKKLYCATQRTAKIATYLRTNPLCAFEVAADIPPYCGVRGQGIAQIDGELGPTILKRLLTRYLDDTGSPLAQRLLARQSTEIAIIIQPTTLFTWNYVDRMKDSLSGAAIEKVCPE